MWKRINFFPSRRRRTAARGVGTTPDCAHAVLLYWCLKIILFILLCSCYRRYLTLPHPALSLSLSFSPLSLPPSVPPVLSADTPRPDGYFCVSKITFYFGIPLGNKQACSRVIIYSKAKNEYVFPFPGSHSTFNNIFIMRFNKTLEQLSDINALLFVAQQTLRQK